MKLVNRFGKELSLDLFDFKQANNVIYRGARDGQGRKIYSMYAGEMQVTGGSGTLTIPASLVNEYKMTDVHLDGALTYMAIHQNNDFDNWYYYGIVNASTSSDTIYSASSQVKKKADGSIVIEVYFGTSITGTKYIHPYISFVRSDGQ